jgi:hypothetical protein
MERRHHERLEQPVLALGLAPSVRRLAISGGNGSHDTRIPGIRRRNGNADVVFVRALQLCRTPVYDLGQESPRVHGRIALTLLQSGT